MIVGTAMAIVGTNRRLTEEPEITAQN